MSITIKLTLAAVAFGFAATTAAAGETPHGLWYDDTGRGAIEITDCGGKLCGKLVWLRDPKNTKACGTAILGDVEATGKTWDNGWIYSPERKSKYDVELTMLGDGKLQVLGYAGTKLFSKEMIWTRAPADLKRCDVIEANAGAPGTTPTPNVPRATGTVAAAQPPVAAAPPQTTASEQKPDPQAEGKPKETQTAQADTAEPSQTPAARSHRKKHTCRIEAPFVTVEFQCNDDD